MAILSIWTGFGPKVTNSNKKAPKVWRGSSFQILGRGTRPAWGEASAARGPGHPLPRPLTAASRLCAASPVQVKKEFCQA